MASGIAGALADIYALGVTRYERLAGEAPFRGAPRTWWFNRS